MDALMLLLKATLLLSLPILAARLLHRAPAAVRHGLWTLTFAALLALPFLASALPTMSVPVPARWAPVIGAAPMPLETRRDERASGTYHDDERHGASDAPVAQSAGLLKAPRAVDGRGAGVAGSTSSLDASSLERSVIAVGAVGDSRADRRGWPAVRVALSMLWLAGTIAATTVLIVSLMRVWRLARTAEELTDPAWQQAAASLGARLGVRRAARLLISARVGTPMAAGVWRPLIFLPASAREWSDDCRDVVLAHEMAHLAVCDPLRHLTARLAVACYWFHPLAWLAARQGTMAREQACDEAVLALGTRPSAYAQVLLDLAESMTLATPAPAIGALPMVERSLLETRLMAILNADVRPGTGRRVLIPAIGVALLMLSIAAAHPVARASSPAASSQSASSASAGSSSTLPRDAAAAGHATTATATIAARSTASTVAWSEALTPSTATTAQANERRDTACQWDILSGRSFNGNVETSTDANGREVLRQQIGRSNGYRIIMTTIGDLRLCMTADDVTDEWQPPSQWLDGTARVVMETRRGSAVQRFELRRQFGGAEQVSWRVGGTERPFDAAAQQWRDRLLDVLDAEWAISALHGRESTLRGEISTVHGQESTLRGQISTVQGEVSTMQGRISTVQGEESTLRGEISTIQGHVSSLQGAIASEQGAIASLQAQRYGSVPAAQRTRVDERIAQHEAAIKDIERQIRDYDAAAKIAAVQRRIDAHNTQRKVAEIEAQIRAFDLAGKVAALERRITELDVAGKVAAIERQITALDVQRRSRELQQQRDNTLKRLDEALRTIR